MSSVIPTNVLYIDLSRRKFWIENRKDLFEEYLGGVGVAVKLLEEELPRGADPLGPENVFVLAVGPFTGLYPMASKTVALFKSPLTGNLGESHAGGRSAIAIRMAGYGAIVVKGAFDRPGYVVVKPGRVEFRDATALWGMRSSYTVGRVLREYEPGAGMRTILRIGRAGEKLVRYACVITETYRHFGRLGLGAVWGSKKLKAMVIIGRGEIKVPDEKKAEYRKMYDEIFKACLSPATKKYHEIGTPVNVLPLNQIGALPTRNLESARFEQAENISGEKFAAEKLARRAACAHCPVACIHIAALRIPYEEEKYFYKTLFVSYDYEPIYALGSMLGVGTTDGVLRLIEEVETLGLDAMSTGVVLAWATEAYQKGLIGKDKTLVELKWGNVEAYVKAIRYIVEQPNEFYQDLAKGLVHAAKKYGGEDFALVFGGNEMPGYHAGPATHLGYAIGARHSHLDNAGYSLDQKLLKEGKTGDKYPSPKEVIDKLVEEEIFRQVLSSLVVCFFARGVYKYPTIAKAFQAVGIDMTEERLKEIGKRIYAEKYKLKIREGFSKKLLKLPRRIFETPTPHGKIDPEYMKKALEYFEEKLRRELGLELPE